ncbi:MAG TPA: HAMP domain-containing sensor histidine kinase [Gaiellaceae bacterium]|nr:HAMP domain-containing sensor histidine kinase [Gaiellaceae bacterium]
MRRFGQSVGAQLSLALLLVVAIALGVVYLTVVPSLRERAIDTRVAELTRIAAKLRLHADPLTDEWVATASEENAGVRVVLLNRLEPAGLVVPYRDSGQLSPRLQGDPVATHALDSDSAQHGAVTDGETTYAEAAVPVLRGSYALLVRDPVELGSIRLVERRVLLAAGVALLIALLLGYGGARMFAQRIRRLERAADRIANGRFDEPVVDTGGGELGALAAAFERMRVRLAHLDDARREFVANASHELRTPLFSLAGFLELLDDEELDEPTRREFLASMREQVDRLTKLASDLLDLSRLDSGRLTVAREPVDLAALAADLAEEFGPLAASSGHRLAVTTVRPVSAEADELRVLQLGRILVENALLHTPPETPVEVRALERDGHAVLEVEDAGGGIREDQRAQLFERFFRLDGTRASGSGLGLAIARQLAELMGGAIELESRPGSTVFSLVLPRAATSPEPFSREKALSAGA